MGHSDEKYLVIKRPPMQISRIERIIMTTRSFIPLHNDDDIKDQKAPEYEIISLSKGREQFIGEKAIKGV